jgi:hypothetical protein
MVYYNRHADATVNLPSAGGAPVGAFSPRKLANARCPEALAFTPGR